MISEEQKKDYLERSGDPYIAENVNMLTHPTDGFCSYRIEGDKLLVVQMYGNGVMWHEILERKAKALGIKTLICTTTRSPKALERKYKYKLIGYVMEKEV